MPINIKFSYLYRDAGNYKNYGEVVLANPDDLSLGEIETLIRSKLIDGLWFCADQFGLPDLHFGDWDNGLDHAWHEFEAVSYTNEPCDTQNAAACALFHIS